MGLLLFPSFLCMYFEELNKILYASFYYRNWSSLICVTPVSKFAADSTVILTLNFASFWQGLPAYDS